MAKPVLLSEIAEQDLEQITDYLSDCWGTEVCEAFLSRFEQVCDIISLSPKMYRVVHKKEKIRKCVLTKQNTIYYRERKDNIEILAIFDTRQDPAKVTEII